MRWKQESNIYWGSPKSFSPSRTFGADWETEVPEPLWRTWTGTAIWISCCPMLPRQPIRRKVRLSFLEGADGYVVPERLELPTGRSGIPAVADINQDGFLDLLFAGGDEGVPIFWGDGTRNYSSSRRDFVAGSKGLRDVEVADLNQDGTLDLVLSRSIEAGKRLTTGFVYWAAGPGEFSKERRDSFEIEGTNLITVADVNQDGWLDLVCPNYNTGLQPGHPVANLPGRDRMAFPAERMFTLPTNSGAGSLVTDFNQDGYTDILMVCHRSEGRSQPNRILRRSRHRFLSLLGRGGRISARQATGNTRPGTPQRLGCRPGQHLRSPS